jgi:transcriptional regulator with XRE-family HTH domain
MITPCQVRMARAALQWTVAALARQAGVTTRTVLRYEHSQNVTLDTILKLKAALEKAGISWIPENGGPATIRPPRHVVGTSPDAPVAGRY